LQPERSHLNLRNGASRNRASHGSCALEMQGTVNAPIASGVIIPIEHLTIMRSTRSETCGWLPYGRAWMVQHAPRSIVASLSSGAFRPCSSKQSSSGCLPRAGVVTRGRPCLSPLPRPPAGSCGSRPASP
jgi:hypothetical protein